MKLVFCKVYLSSLDSRTYAYYGRNISTTLSVEAALLDKDMFKNTTVFNRAAAYIQNFKGNSSEDILYTQYRQLLKDVSNRKALLAKHTNKVEAVEKLVRINPNYKWIIICSNRTSAEMLSRCLANALFVPRKNPPKKDFSCYNILIFVGSLPKKLPSLNVNEYSLMYLFPSPSIFTTMKKLTSQGKHSSDPQRTCIVFYTQGTTEEAQFTSLPPDKFSAIPSLPLEQVESLLQATNNTPDVTRQPEKIH